MESSQAKELIRKYREGTLTEPEKAILESWYLDMARSRPVTMNETELKNHLDEIWEALPVHEKEPDRSVGTVKPLPLYRWLAIAASIVLVGGIGFYFLSIKADKLPLKNEVAFKDDAAPGDNRAMLTLADGKKIMLDDMKTGELAHEGSMAIVKTKEGEIEYRSNSNELEASERKAVTYNTIATPRAGQYQVKLPDGTQVWLNAVSSIRFPTVFSTKERVVEIRGEVYFEVAKATVNNRRLPFKVFAGNQVVEVLGTRFNVNSYSDEGSIKTTLLEGSIRLQVNGDQKGKALLKPGQQALYIFGSGKSSAAFQPFQVLEVDTRSVVAWKDGYFRIDNSGLPELMRQISRWYDVEIVYEGPVKEYEFVGQIERSSNLSAVLKILELSDVRSRVEGKKVIIMN